MLQRFDLERVRCEVRGHAVAQTPPVAAAAAVALPPPGLDHAQLLIRVAAAVHGRCGTLQTSFRGVGHILSYRRSPVACCALAHASCSSATAAAAASNGGEKVVRLSANLLLQPPPRRDTQ